MNKETSYFVTYGADTTDDGQEIGLLSTRRCNDLIKKLAQDKAQNLVVVLTAGTDPNIPNSIAIKTLMSNYITAKLQEKGFLPTSVIENQVDLFSDGTTVSIITATEVVTMVKNVWGTCNETIAMLEILKTFQDVKHVSVIATKCNWFRTWVIWKIFSDYEIDLFGSIVKRDWKYYAKETLKTIYAVFFGIGYRIGIVKLT